MGFPSLPLPWRDHAARDAPDDERASGPAPVEWEEVPIYTAIKRTAEPWVVKAFNIHPVGTEHVPMEDGVVVASNHASFFDPVFLGAVIDRPLHWMAKSSLFRHPLGDAFFRRAGQIKVDRIAGGNHAAVDACVELVGSGRAVGIFPEGSRSLDGRLRRGRTGVARVALETGAPVVPVALTSYETMPKHTLVPHLDHPLVIAVGEPLYYEGMAELTSDRAACRKVTDEIMDHIGRLLEVARTRRDALALDEERGET